MGFVEQTPVPAHGDPLAGLRYDGSPAAKRELRQRLSTVDVAVACECGRVVAKLHGNNGTLAEIEPRRGQARPVANPHERADGPVRGTPQSELLAAALAARRWRQSRWQFVCERRCGSGSVVRRFEALQCAYSAAVTRGRTELTLGVDL